MTAAPLMRDRCFGATQAVRHAGDFDLRWMRPTIPAHDMAEHAHGEAHFVLVLGGTYQSLAYRKGATTTGTALVFNPPGTEHRDCFTELRGSFMTITLPAPRYAELTPAARPHDPLHLSHPATVRTALALFGAACAAPEQVAAHERLHAESLAVELLAATAPGQAAPAQRDPPAWIGMAAEMIQDRSAEALGLEEIAQAVGVHPVYLSRAFRRWMHQTPGEYHRRCRMERAFGALLRGECSTAQIALAAGFADQAHFTRAFAGLYGIAPARFTRLLHERAQVCSVQVEDGGGA